MFGSLRSVAGACLPRARPFFLAPIYFLAPATQATCSVYWNSNMTPRLSGHISIFGLFFLCSSLFWELRDNGVLKNLEFLLRRPRSHVRIFIFRTWGIVQRTCVTAGGCLDTFFLNISKLASRGFAARGAETMETGTKNRCVIEATHVLRRKLRKN